MKIVDVNLLVYAHDRSSPFHVDSLKWLQAALSDLTDPLAIPNITALGFIRLTTNAKVATSPLSITKACEIVESWYKAGAIPFETDAQDFTEIARLMAESHGGLHMITDAYLAAVAIRNHATIYSNDLDFQRFKGLKVKNPLVR